MICQYKKKDKEKKDVFSLLCYDGTVDYIPGSFIGDFGPVSANSYGWCCWPDKKYENSV